jgi:hypothetical protein
MAVPVGVTAICAGRRKAGKACILPEATSAKAAHSPRPALPALFLKRILADKHRPDLPVATGGAGASFIAIPAAADAQAGVRFCFDAYAVRRLAGLARALPALATGAALTGDGLV